jgi:hypothetical protein
MIRLESHIYILNKTYFTEGRSGGSQLFTTLSGFGTHGMDHYYRTPTIGPVYQFIFFLYVTLTPPTGPIPHDLNFYIPVVS